MSNLTGWERLFRSWYNTYYSSFFVLICLLIALITITKFWKKEKLYSYFRLYIISAFALLFLVDIISLPVLNLKGRDYSAIEVAANLSFGLIEYLIFLNFFTTVLKSRILKRLMRMFAVAFIVALFLFLLKLQDPTFSLTDIVTYADFAISAELLFLALLCITYYYELLGKKIVSNLLLSSSFWIVSGLFCYCTTIIPFFLISKNVNAVSWKVYQTLYAVHYFFWGLLFLAIAKSCLCRSNLSTKTPLNLET